MFTYIGALIRDLESNFGCLVDFFVAVCKLLMKRILNVNFSPSCYRSNDQTGDGAG